MAIKIKKHRQEEISIPTASLADIVFLLLIFFLVSTSMNPNKGLGLTLPPKGEQVKINPDDVLSIFINNKGEILLEQNEANINDVRPRIVEELSKNEKLVVSIFTHKEADYDQMIKVLDEVKRANAKRISLAVPEF